MYSYKLVGARSRKRGSDLRYDACKRKCSEAPDRVDANFTVNRFYKRMNMRKSNMFSDTVETAQQDLEKLEIKCLTES